jgi:hypothetical protein
MLALIWSTTTSKILLNGLRGCPIKHAKGLRQGDPLSLMLFILFLLDRRGLSPTDYINKKEVEQTERKQKKQTKREKRRGLNKIMEPLFHIWCIFLLGSVDDHSHFSLECCFAAVHRRVLISEQPAIPLSPNAPTHNYNKLHRKLNL